MRIVTKFLNEKKSWILYMTIGLIWLVILGVLQYRIIYNYFNSDWAADLIFARQCWKDGSIISKNLSYTTEFKLFDLQMIKAPLFYFFDSWVKISAWGNTLAFFALYVGGLFMLLKVGINKKLIVCLSALTLILPFSWPYFEIALVAGFYTIKIVLEVWILGLFYLILQIRHKYKLILAYLFIIILSVLAGIGGIRLSLLVFIPLVITCIIQWLTLIKKNKVILERNIELIINVESRKCILLSLLILGCNFIGYILNVRYFAKEYQFETMESILFGDIHAINLFERIGDRFAGILDVLGYSSSVNVFSVWGIRNLIIIALVICVLYCYIYVLKNSEKYSYYQNNLVIFSIVTIVMNGFIFSITDYNSVRYWVPIIIFVIPVIGLFLKEKQVYLSDIIIKMVISMVCLAFIVVGCLTTITTVVNSKNNAYREPCLEYLLDNEYDFGYSTYWNANVMTALANGEVEVASITNPDKMEFYIWGTTKEYYRKDYHEGKCFILLTVEEYETYKDGKVISSGTEVYRDQYFLIFGYNDIDQLLNLAGANYLN